MKLNRIKIENFLSIENAEIDFENFSDLVRVVGINEDTKPKSSNGAGKSTVIEAIAYGLFGKTIRKSTEKNLHNLHTKGTCKITLVVNDNVVIERVKKPPMLTVTVDGEKCTKDSIQETQKYLESFLNTNQSVFLASIVFGQGNSTNFLTATPDEKRTIIENFLNVSELFKHRNSIKALKSLHNNNKKICSTLADEASLKLNKLIKRRDSLISMCKEANSFLSSDKAKFIQTHTISQIQEMERTSHDLKVQLASFESSLSDSKVSLEKSKSRVDKLSEAKCEHCNKVSSASYKIIQNEQKTILELQEHITYIKSRIKDIKKELEEKDIPITLQDFELIEKVKGFESEIGIINSDIEEQKSVCEARILEMNSSQKSYDLMRFWETAFSEQGLVKYVIRNILSFFNERSNYYLSFLTKGNFTIQFDDSLQEAITNKGKPAYFDTLSGGEKKKISLAVMLALNDLLLLTGKDRSNVVFFDEIADSLDEEGIRGLYELIQKITQSKRLFIISHNDYLTSLIEDWADVLEVKKKSHITTVRKV